MPHPVTWTAQSYTQLTADPGMETHPALSPNGQQLVYSQRPTSAVYRDLFIRSIDQGTPVRITSDPADDHSAAWSPAGDRIAFVRTTPGGHCAILVVPMPVGAERTAAQCKSAVYTRVSWLDADTLVFGDRPGPDVPWRLRSRRPDQRGHARPDRAVSRDAGRQRSDGLAQRQVDGLPPHPFCTAPTTCSSRT